MCFVFMFLVKMVFGSLAPLQKVSEGVWKTVPPAPQIVAFAQKEPEARIYASLLHNFSAWKNTLVAIPDQANVSWLDGYQGLRGFVVTHDGLRSFIPSDRPTWDASYSETLARFEASYKQAFSSPSVALFPAGKATVAAPAPVLSDSVRAAAFGALAAGISHFLQDGLRKEAFNALWQVVTTPANSDPVRAAAMSALGSVNFWDMPKQQAETIDQLLTFADKGAELLKVAAIGQLGLVFLRGTSAQQREAMNLLSACIKNGTDSAQAQTAAIAAIAIDQIRYGSAAEELVDLLILGARNSSPLVRIAATEKLGVLAGSSKSAVALACLTAAAKNDSELIRAAALKAILSFLREHNVGAQQKLEVMDLLRNAYFNGNDCDKIAVMEGLNLATMIGEKETEEARRWCMYSSERGSDLVKSAAIDALGRVVTHHKLRKFQVLEIERVLINAINGFLEDSNAAAVKVIGLCLGHQYHLLEDGGAMRALLIAAAKSHSEVVRVAAMEGIGSILCWYENKELTSLLISGATNGSDLVKVAAFKEIGLVFKYRCADTELKTTVIQMSTNAIANGSDIVKVAALNALFDASSYGEEDRNEEGVMTELRKLLGQ